MSQRAFVDSNILIYAVTEGPRAVVAQAAVEAGHAISVQVLNEFANVARRKLGRAPEEIRQATNGYRAAFDVLPITLKLHDAALNVAQRYQLNFYDGLIVAAALDADCTILYTEDLQHGQLIEKRLRIVNPFAVRKGSP